jgi:hypothetical protein
MHSRAGVIRICLVSALALVMPARAQADWVAAAFLGHAHTIASTIVLTQPARNTRVELVDVNYRGESLKSPQYYSVRMTWIPDDHPWMGIEGEWIHAKAFTETRRDVRVRGTLNGVPVDASVFLYSYVQRLAMSHGLNFILANFVVRHGVGPVDDRGIPRLTVVGRIGAGPTRPHVESTIGDASFDRYENGGLGTQLGGGVEFSLWRGLGAVTEYKFTSAHPKVEVANGRAEIPAHSHHFAAGLQFRF